MQGIQVVVLPIHASFHDARETKGSEEKSTDKRINQDEHYLLDVGKGGRTLNPSVPLIDKSGFPFTKLSPISGTIGNKQLKLAVCMGRRIICFQTASKHQFGGVFHKNLLGIQQKERNLFENSTTIN